METARLSLDVCCMRESLLSTIETDVAVGMDNGLRATFTTSVKESEN